MKLYTAFLVSFILSQGISAAEIMYTCTPTKPTPFFSNIILKNAIGPNYQLTIMKEDSVGNLIKQSAAAEYYDDMTYLGYYSRELNASLELDYPVNLKEAARFYLGKTLVYVNCI